MLHAFKAQAFREMQKTDPERAKRWEADVLKYGRMEISCYLIILNIIIWFAVYKECFGG